MSTLQVVTAQVTTLSDGTNSTSSTNAILGSAKAWVNFNGTGTVSTNQTIRASFNVSTVFKNGTGTYTVNFTNSLTDANYAVGGTGQNEFSIGGNSQLSSSVQLIHGRYSTGAQDYANISVIILR